MARTVGLHPEVVHGAVELTVSWAELADSWEWSWGAGRVLGEDLGIHDHCWLPMRRVAELYTPGDSPRYDQEPDWVEEQRAPVRVPQVEYHPGPPYQPLAPGPRAVES